MTNPHIRFYNPAQCGVIALEASVDHRGFPYRVTFWGYTVSGILRRLLFRHRRYKLYSYHDVSYCEERRERRRIWGRKVLKERDRLPPDPLGRRKALRHGRD